MTLLIFSFSIALMMLVPIGAAVLLRRRYAVAWYLFCVGMATFVGSQLLHLPLNDWLVDSGMLPAGPEAGSLVRWALILGLTAGLSETLARAVGYFFLFRFRRAEHPQDAVMVGLGHGGIEAFGLVAVLAGAQFAALWTLQGTDLQALGLPGAQAAALAEQMTIFSAPWLSLAGVLERMIALTLHVALSVLVWQAFRSRKVWPALAAVLYHALFDGLAVYMAQLTDSVWLVEGGLALMMLPGVLWTTRVWRSYPAAPEHAAQPVRVEAVVFQAALLKELRQQWRTNRVLVVVAVFLLFGLGSPLLARFTPELLSGIEGAEQFASLIPEPTTADATGQYVKNITQFGFIIAVLLGMGAVAGEKESGTAAMMLSKPLPRWAFLLSKFTAQAAVYALAFAVAAAGAYAYTQVLFGGLEAGPFLWGNVLLLLWLLVYAAVTLLGSTLASTTAMGAGLSLLGAVILLLAGGLPQVGPFAPGGLVGWAGQLGLGVAVTPNGGALVAGAALIMTMLICAVAAFEVQEL